MISRIGIAGAAGSGKTTAASYLVDKYGFEILGFATPLYFLGEIHNFPEAEWHSRVYGWTLDRLQPLGYTDAERWRFVYDTLDVMDSTPVVEGKNRTLLQLLGTEVGRGLDENLWTKIFEYRVEKLGPDAKIINDNLRFPNELESLNRLDFTTLYIDVPLEVRAARYEQEYGKPMSAEQLSHSSEAHLEYIRQNSDYVFENTGDKNKLLVFLDSFVKNAAYTGRIG